MIDKERKMNYLQVRDHPEEPGVDGKITLKLISGKHTNYMWSTFREELIVTQLIMNT
jgi:hypothetical protein